MQLTAGGAAVSVTGTGNSTISLLTDNLDGTYTFTATNSTPEIEVYTAAVGGAPITSGTASVVYVSGGAVDLTNSTISATTPVVADGISTSIITVTLFDNTPVQLTAGGAAVSVTGTGNSTISLVTDNLDGTYTFTATNSTAETEVYTALVGGAPITSGTASVVYQPVGGPGVVDPTDAATTIVGVTPVVADGISESIITVILSDSNGNQLPASGGLLVLSTTGSGIISAVVDNTDGTYSATMTNNTAETVTLSGTVNGVAITNTSDVVFTLVGAPETVDPTDAATTIVGVTPVVADGIAESIITVILSDSSGNQLPASGGLVVLSTTGTGVISGCSR